MVKKISPSGRNPNEPNMQFLKPPTTPEQQQMIDDIKAAMWAEMSRRMTKP